MLDTLHSPVGVVENNNDPNDLRAWCYACEEKYQSEGGLTEVFRAFNSMALVCVVCYVQIKERHLLSSQ